MIKRLLTQINMDKLLLIIWVLALCCGVQVAQGAVISCNVFERFSEPMTQPSDTIFKGTFDYDTVTHTVSNLKGILSESMTGGDTGYPNDTMTWLTLNNQLVSWHDDTLGGTFAVTFKNTTTNTFWTGLGGDGWSPQAGIAVGGLYYGFPGANPGNAYALIFVPDNPLAVLNQAQIDKLAYADFAPGGMMGNVGMTGVLVRGTGPIDPMTGLPNDSKVGTMDGYPVEQMITCSDTVPDAFNFTSQTDVALSTVIESNAITVGGITASSPISITGGEYAVSTDAGSSWSTYSTTIPGTVSNGNQVKVHLTSSASYSSTTTATLTIGGVSGTFNVTTAAPPPDTVPDPFSFTPVTGADPATAFESNPITVTGINSPAAISITGGSYAVSSDGGFTWGAWASTPGTVALNDQVKVHGTSSAAANTTVTVTLTIGGVSGSFSVTTNQYNAPPTWMPMTMLNITLGAGNVLAIQDLSTKSPFNTIPPTYPVLSTVATAGAFDPAKPWAVLNGTAYSRRLGWNPGAGMNATAIQTAFGANASIWIEKISSSPGLETFQAVGLYGVNANGATTIDPAANGYAPIFGAAGSSAKWQWDYMMDHNANAVPAAYITTPNQAFSATYRIYVGDSTTGADIAPSAATTTAWGWTGPAVIPDNVPDAFSFSSQTGVALSTVIESNVITVSGLAVPSLISISGGEYTISTDSGATWSAWSTTVPATVANGAQVKVRQTSSASHSTLTTAVLTIGGVSGSFAVTTAAPAPVSVPNVVGLTQAAAQSALTTATLTVGTITQASSPIVAAGSVISQAPIAGTSVLAGTAVNLVVSSGPAVPDVINFNQTAAGAAISEAALTVGNIDMGNSGTVPAGSVISQNPASGTTVPPGTAVNLVVSLGPAPVSGELSLSTLSDAYGLVAAGATLRARVVTFTGPVDFNLNKTVSLNGGYSDNTFTTTTGFTTLHGKMIISRGTLRVNNLKIY